MATVLYVVLLKRANKRGWEDNAWKEREESFWVSGATRESETKSAELSKPRSVTESEQDGEVSGREQEPESLED